MNILRLSTLSLTLAITVITLGYANPSFADNPKTGECNPGHCDHGGEDPPSGLTYTVDLRGTTVNFVTRGAFEFDPANASSAVSATLNSKGLDLTGAGPVTMKRAGSIANCAGGDADDVSACIIWNDVFNLCGLLGPWNGSSSDDTSGPTKLDQFTVDSGDWSVSQGGGRRWIFFGFTIPPAQSNGTDRDLSAALRLSSACSHPDTHPSCDHDDDAPLFPTEAGSDKATKLIVDHASVHLRGHAGVTHKAFCHADTGSLVINGSTLGSTLVITLKAAE